jgi:CubicO group peptidase (beta-lactamase class C family)
VTSILPPTVIAAQHLSADGATRELTGSLAPDERFPIASVTKTLVALLAARLCQDGAIAWDEPLTAPDDLRLPISLRMLLRHTATAPFELHAAHWGPVALTEAELEGAVARPPRLPLPPGTFHYSNVGYAIAARVMEHATGQALQTLLAERLLRPLGMTRTSFPDETEGGLVLGAAAAPAGDLWSTLDDLTTLARALDGRRPDVVTWPMLALLLEGAVPDSDGVHYGAGIRTHAVGRHRVLVCIGHILDRRTCVAVWPRRGASVLVAEAACDRDELWRAAAAPWRRDDAPVRTWWLDGQAVMQLQHGDEVDLVLDETTWPFPLFCGRADGRTLTGVDWRGMPLELHDEGDALAGTGIRLTADVDASGATEVER